MATLIDDGSGPWVSNETYQIAATDPLQGAATGAAFNGLGQLNQPHQQLANRTAFLKGRQDTNIANIAALQSQQSTDVANISRLLSQQSADVSNISTLQGQVGGLLAFANRFGISGNNPGYIELGIGESGYTAILNFGYAYAYAGSQETEGGFTWWYGSSAPYYEKPFGTALAGWACAQDTTGHLVVNALIAPGGVGDSAITVVVHASAPINAYFYWFALGYSG